MTLGFWEITKSDPGIGVVISGDRLRIDNVGNEFTPAKNVACLRKSDSFTRGHIIGKIRTKMEVTDSLVSITREGSHGITCMWSQADLTGTSGSAYGFVMYFDGTIHWRLIKYTAGITNSSSALILQTGDTTLTPAIGTNYTMQLEWAHHVLIGGTALKCSVGLASNEFNDLETVYDYTDGNNELTTSVGEGLVYGDLEGQQATDLKRVFWDDTTIVDLEGVPIT